MKKISIALILLLVINLIAVPALAAQSAHISVYASTSTVTRGQTFTVIVSTSAIENCISGGVFFEYDTNVFETVGGKAMSSLNGFTAGIYNQNGKLAGYFMNSNATVQGEIFQVTLKVKDNAAFGTHNIYGEGSANDTSGTVSCNTGCASVSVVCNHSWSNWTGTQPTCGAAGSLSRSCSICGATENDTPAATGNHNFDSWSKVDDNTHKHICEVCSKEETASHTWNSGVITKKPTCKEEGVKTFTCTGCSATKTEDLEKLTTHTYDHDCDTDCNVCGVTRETTHKYKTTWSKDKNEHWHECSVCKDKQDIAAHTPGAAATEYKAQTCTTCGYVIKAALGHKHKYATTWTTDEKGHWYTCSGCEEKGSYADHDFENDCDTDCSVCGYTREIEHAFDEKWTTDETNHWHVCASCGLKQDEAAHEPGAEATATTAQTCTICQYEIAPALGVPETTEEPTVAPTTEAVVPDVEDKGNDQQQIIVIAVGAVIAIAVIGLIIVFLAKKKKKA